MKTYYEVWDYETRNMIATFDSEAESVAFLRRMRELNGADGVRELAVLRQAPDASGEYESTLVLEGEALSREAGART